MSIDGSVAGPPAATPASIINGSNNGPNGGDASSNNNNATTGSITNPGSIAPSIIGSGNGAATSSAFSSNNTPIKAKLQSGGRRIEVDGMMTEFQKQLGSNWDRYRDLVTSFLIGKLTRTELQQELDQVLDKKLVYMHNQFLLANLANALRDAPQGESGVLTGWSKKNSDSSRNVKGDSQLAKIKEDIMELTLRERKRIKAIAKEPANKRPQPQSGIIQTRQAMLPRIPFVNERQGSTDGKNASPAEAQPSATNEGGEGQEVANTNTNPVAWTQDIIHAYEAPLASEAYEIPDKDQLQLRMLGISLEHGLLQGVGSQAPEVMVAGLEYYLKDLVEQLTHRVRLRKKPGEEDQLTAKDVNDVLKSSSTTFVEMNGPTYRLQDVMLRDDDADDVEMENAPGLDVGDTATTPELQALLNDILSA